MGTYEIGGRKWTFRCHWQISRQKWINLKSINIRPIIIITQIQNMNLMLNRKDVNKILAKTHFKCKESKKKQHIFAKTCLPVMPSFLPHVLWGRSQVSLFSASVVSPGSLYFYILLLLIPVSGSVLLLFAGAHKISLKYLFPEKMFIEVCCQKCQKCNTICVTTFFYWISRVCKRKRFKYIHQNLRYYETIEQIHLMVVIESYVWEKNYNIWSFLIPPPPSSKTTKE
jgi:hypothetical protein